MPDDFEDRWHSLARNRSLPPDCLQCVQCGPWQLPGSAAPFLNFEENAQLANVLAKYSPYEAWPEETLKAVEGLLYLGSDGAGDPICLEECTGTVWLLDHEVHFQRREFVNSSVLQLQEALLAYRSSSTTSSFRERLMEIDPAALGGDAMWSYCAEWIDQED